MRGARRRIGRETDPPVWRYRHRLRSQPRGTMV